MVSIIINNFNYRRFLAQSIDSALSQTDQPVEMIVVDDGSTDGSGELIKGYGNKIKAILKGNGGQASAMNAGFLESTGDVVIFLDSDDVLLPDAVPIAKRQFSDGVVKVHWPLWTIDESGKRTGSQVPSGPLPDGDYRQLAMERGPSCIYSPPTSGNAWARSFLEKVMPIPESDFALCADDYLFSLVPAFGEIRSVDEPQALYRIHSNNNHQSRSFEEKLRVGLEIQEKECHTLAGLLGCDSKDISRWQNYMWFPRLQRALGQLMDHVPLGASFVLIDGNEWGTDAELRGRKRLLFGERDGNYWGPPVDDQEAVNSLEAAINGGAEFLVLAWPAFWWLDHYKAFWTYVNDTYHTLSTGDDLVMYDLKRSSSALGGSH
jgi:glycosyltransferase involved in cell wall biosynthesis